MAKRSYGSGRLFVRVDAAGVESWYGSWRVGGRRVKRRLGAKRRASPADGLTRTPAEAELRRLMATARVVPGGGPWGGRGTRTSDQLEHVLERKRTPVAHYRGYLP